MSKLTRYKWVSERYVTPTFRIYALNDSNLVMNDWMTGGTSDTSKLVLYVDKTGSVAQ